MGWVSTPMQIMNYLYVSGAYTQTYNLYAGTGNASVGYSCAGFYIRVVVIINVILH